MQRRAGRPRGGPGRDGGGSVRHRAEPGRAAGADEFQVIAVLDHRAPAGLGRGGVEPLDPEHGQGRDPVDCLGDPGRLGQVQRAQPGDATAAAEGQRLAAAGHPAAHDLGDPGRAGVVDPVVQAAAGQGVVKVPGPVGGEDHDRRMGRPDCAQLRDGHGGLGQQFKRERLEFGVGAVDLVQEQHRRPRAGMLQRLQERAPQQVLGGEQVVLRHGARAPRPAGCRAAGAGGSTRRGPRRRRFPRSTAAGTAGCRGAGQRLRGLRLPDPRLALEQDRLRQPDGQEQRRRQSRRRPGSRSSSAAISDPTSGTRRRRPPPRRPRRRRHRAPRP